jgi:hypothetical protein
MITQAERNEAQAELRRWYDRNGVEDGWVAWAACGMYQPDPLYPETFFSIDADDPSTYRAQAKCRACPVREICDDVGTSNDYPGVWGGIWRANNGLTGLLCTTPGCLHYQRTGTNSVPRKHCTACQEVLDAEAARVKAAEAARKAEERAARIAAQAGTRTKSGKISTGRPPGRPPKTREVVAV